MIITSTHTPLQYQNFAQNHESHIFELASKSTDTGVALTGIMSLDEAVAIADYIGSKTNKGKPDMDVYTASYQYSPNSYMEAVVKEDADPILLKATVGGIFFSDDMENKICSNLASDKVAEVLAETFFSVTPISNGDLIEKLLSSQIKKESKFRYEPGTYLDGTVQGDSIDAESYLFIAKAHGIFFFDDQDNIVCENNNSDKTSQIIEETFSSLTTIQPPEIICYLSAENMDLGESLMEAENRVNELEESLQIISDKNSDMEIAIIRHFISSK